MSYFFWLIVPLLDTFDLPDHKFSDLDRIKYSRLGLKPLFCHFCPWLMLISHTVLSVVIPLLSRIRWSIFSLTSTHVARHRSSALFWPILNCYSAATFTIFVSSDHISGVTDLCSPFAHSVDVAVVLCVSQYYERSGDYGNKHSANEDRFMLCLSAS